MTLKLMLVVLAISPSVVPTELFSEKVIVGGSTGISLETAGYLLGREGNHYRSLFLRIVRPINETSVCADLCHDELSDLVSTWRQQTSKNCSSEWKKAKPGAPETGRMTIDESPGKECMRQCLLDPNCAQVGVHGNECVFRPRALSSDEMIEGNAGDMEVNLECITGLRGRREMCNRAAKELGESTVIALDQENRRFVEETWRSLNQIVPNSTETRNKRGISNWLTNGGVGLGLLSAGYNLWSTNRLKKHVQEVEEDYKKFRKEQTSFDRLQLDYNRKTISVVRNLDERLQQVECGIDRDVKNLISQRRLTEWRNTMNQVYRNVLGGSRVGGISPVIFPVHYMNQLVQNDPALNKTAYRDNIELAYRLGLMTVLDHGPLDEHLTIHVTLSFPDLGSRGVKPVYTVLQTGLAVNKTTCGRFELPQRVYEEEGEFYAMESAICEERANLHLCWGGAGSGRRKVACLSDEEKCQTTLETCSTQIRETRAGLQVRTAEVVRAFTITEPEKWKVVDLGPTQTMYFNRSRYGGVLIGDELRTMGTEDYEVELNTLPNLQRWVQVFEDRWKTHKERNLTEMVRTVREQEKILRRIETQQHKSEKRWKEIVLGVAIAVGTLLLAGSLALGCRELYLFRQAKAALTEHGPQPVHYRAPIARAFRAKKRKLGNADEGPSLRDRGEETDTLGERKPHQSLEYALPDNLAGGEILVESEGEDSDSEYSQLINTVRDRPITMRRSAHEDIPYEATQPWDAPGDDNIGRSSPEVHSVPHTQSLDLTPGQLIAARMEMVRRREQQ